MCSIQDGERYRFLQKEVRDPGQSESEENLDINPHYHITSTTATSMLSDTVLEAIPIEQQSVSLKASLRTTRE